VRGPLEPEARWLVPRMGPCHEQPYCLMLCMLRCTVLWSSPQDAKPSLQLHLVSCNCRSAIVGIHAVNCCCLPGMLRIACTYLTKLSCAAARLCPRQQYVSSRYLSCSPTPRLAK
jgi:hypothetical protein